MRGAQDLRWLVDVPQPRLPVAMYQSLSRTPASSFDGLQRLSGL